MKSAEDPERHDGDRRPHWRERPEAGTLLALRATVWMALHLGRRAVHVTMVPVAAYFVAVRRVERRASAAFLEKVHGRKVGLRAVFAHFLTFARVAVDRVFFLSGSAGRIPVAIHDDAAIQRVVDQRTGTVVVCAHFGSFEAARVIGETQYDVRVRVVLNRGVGQRLITVLESLDARLRDAIIDSEDSAVSIGLRIAEAIEAGEWVGFLADRHGPGDRTIECDFLGERARFAAGPFMIAAACKAPIVCLFPEYDAGRYTLSMEVLSHRLESTRENRAEVIRRTAQDFADRLGRRVQAAPMNWFNFYDFWQT